MVGRNEGAAASKPLSLHPPRRVHEGLKQHAVQPQVMHFSEFLYADRHAEVTGGRLISVSTEHTVPPGQIEAEVTVGFLADNGVVDACRVSPRPGVASGQV